VTALSASEAEEALEAQLVLAAHPPRSTPCISGPEISATIATMSQALYYVLINHGWDEKVGHIIMGKEIYGTPLLEASATNINVMEGIEFHEGTSSPGLTLKRATRLSRMAPWDRTDTASY